ncbi:MULTISPECIES: hypothetical protein [unclassified Streptococcus]|uniref:hypothetical protein n=1 Tax=unclassified Streptococcus TaxID=2608887 RepID=UPI000517D220|nr:ABC transporter permease [Streptococcus sp.]
MLMKNRKFRVIPFLPLVLYLLVYLYGYSGIEPEPGVAYGYLYLFLLLVPVVIAYFVLAVTNFATLMGEVTYLFKGQLLGHLYRLYFSIFFFSILFCGLNYYQLIAPYGPQMKISAGEAYNPLAPYAIPLLLFLLGLLGNLFFWDLQKIEVQEEKE